MRQSVTLTCKGLYTYPNNLSAIPNGGLIEADNIYIDRPDTAEPRRGFKIFTQSALTTVAKSLHNYQQRILVHQSTKLQYETDPTGSPGTFTNYQESIDGFLTTASVISPDATNGLRIKSAESNKNFYFTSSKGIRKLDGVGNSVLNAGVPQALDFDLNLISEDGFLEQNNTIAYRTIWGLKDANSNLITGSPSQPEVIYYFGNSQFISDLNDTVNGLNLEKDSVGAGPLLNTYLPTISSTSTLTEVYTKQKALVSALNQENGATATLTNQSLTYTAKTKGTAGNSITIRLVNPMANSQPLVISVAGSAISASLATDGGGAITTTPTLLKVAILAKAQAWELVDVTGSGASPVTALSATPLTGGLDGLTSKDYEAGGTIEKTLITFKSKTLSTASSYLLFQDTAGTTYYLWVNKGGSDPAPDPNVQTDLRLDYIGIELNLNTPAIIDTSDSEEVAVRAQLAITASAAQVNLSRSDASLTISTFIDAVVTDTVDGATPTTYFIDKLQDGTVLSDGDLTLTSLQDGFNSISLLLEAETSLVISTFSEARTTKAVQLDHITIPAEILNLSASGTSFFYQIYRSRQFPLSDVITVVPDDELQLVYESTPTQAELDKGYVGPITDITTEDFRATGALLYTNPSQGGILQSNDRPPFALDLALFQNIMFYANTSQAFSLQLALLTGKASTAPDDPGFNGGVIATLTNQGLTYISKRSGTAGNAITIRLLDPTANTQPLSVTVATTAITVHLATDGAGAIITTANQIKAAINAHAIAGLLVSVTGSGSSAVTALGTTNLSGGTACDTIDFANGTTVDNFSIAFVDTAVGDNFQLGYIALIDETDTTPSQLIDQMARKIVKAINRYEDNSFLEAIYLSGFDTTPGQILIRNRNVYTPIFTMNSTINEVRIAFNPNLGSADTVANNQTNVNYLHYSKFQQPEAVPATNYFSIGAGNQPIIRILALRDSLIVFKTDGIFRVSGLTGNLQVTGFDNTAIIIAPDSAYAGNNQIYCLANQGIVRVTESDVGIISRPIEDKINQLLSLNLFPYIKSASHGIFYATERKYYLWVPTERTDSTATQCFVYNIFTETWTRLPIEKTCALVNVRDNRLYLGPGDTLHLEQERKNYDMYDYADRESTIQLVSQDNLILTLQNVTGIVEGDAIEQVEYITQFIFNRLLIKLDNDSGLTAGNYFSTLQSSLKSDILTKLNSLADKLDLGPSGTTDKNYRAVINAIVGSTPVIVQQKYNALIAKLNADTGVVFNNYPLVTQNPAFNTHILSIDEDANTVEVQDYIEWDAGNVTIYKNIPTTVTWAPNHAGNPLMSKQFSEASVALSSSICRVLSLGFTSDISQDFESIEFSDDSVAGWDRIAWGTMPWGSSPEPRAFRTYIPRLKQRCRFISTKFTHTRALENYLLNGVSLSYMPVQQRVSR